MPRGAWHRGFPASRRSLWITGALGSPSRMLAILRVTDPAIRETMRARRDRKSVRLWTNLWISRPVDKAVDNPAYLWKTVTHRVWITCMSHQVQRPHRVERRHRRIFHQRMITGRSPEIATGEWPEIPATDSPTLNL